MYPSAAPFGAWAASWSSTKDLLDSGRSSLATASHPIARRTIAAVMHACNRRQFLLSLRSDWSDSSRKNTRVHGRVQQHPAGFRPHHRRPEGTYTPRNTLVRNTGQLRDSYGTFRFYVSRETGSADGQE